MTSNRDEGTVRIRFGLSHTARELEVDVDDPVALVEQFSQAVGQAETVFWITERDGRRHGLVVDKIVFIDVAPDEARKGIGFSNA